MNLVIGASGTLGSRLSSRLLQSGKPVRAVSRDPGKLSQLREGGAQTVRGDLRDSSWMEAALEGVQALFLLSHGLVPPSRANSPYVIDDLGNRRMLDAARRTGVQRVYFLSSYLARSHAPTRFGAIKFGIEEYLKQQGFVYTVVRPGAFTETHALRLLAEPLLESGKVNLFGRAATPINWISADDIADYMLRISDDPRARNSSTTIGGPDVLSRAQVLDLIEEVLGRKARRIHVPRPVLHATRVLSRPINPGLSCLVDMALAEEVSSTPDDWAPQHLDWTAPTTVEQVVRRWAEDRKKSPGHSQVER